MAGWEPLVCASVELKPDRSCFHFLELKAEER